MFLSFDFQLILELVNFETLNHFSPLSFEICVFSSFNKNLLGLFDISYVFELFILFDTFLL